MALTPDEVGQIVDALELLDWVVEFKSFMEKQSAPGADTGEMADSPDHAMAGGQAEGEITDAELEEQSGIRKMGAEYGHIGPGSAHERRNQTGDDSDPQRRYEAELPDGSAGNTGEAAGSYSDLRDQQPTRRQPKGSAEGSIPAIARSGSVQEPRIREAASPYNREHQDVIDRGTLERATYQRDQMQRDRDHAHGDLERYELAAGLSGADARLRSARETVAGQAMQLALASDGKLSYEQALFQLGIEPPPSLVSSC